jgi:ubiquinol oxidase
MTIHLLLLPQLQDKYGCHAMMLETVAAVPGMVGGMLLHFKSLRRFEESGGWIRTLLDEAENERMHLMTLIQVLTLLPHLPALLLQHLLLQFLSFFFFFFFSD